MTSKQKQGKDNLRLSPLDLQKVKLAIPAGALPPGTYIVAVFSANSNEVGYLTQGELPLLRPIGDIPRLNTIKKIVGSGEVVNDKNRQGETVKVVANRFKPNAVEPNMAPGAPKAIADTMGVAELLRENAERLARNVSRSPYAGRAREYLLNMVTYARQVLEEYIAHQATSGGIKTPIKDFVETKPIPMWVFTHLTTKNWVTEVPQDSPAELVFPRSMSKGIGLKISEWRRNDLTNELGSLLNKSRMVQKMTVEATTDIMVGSTAAQRGTRLEAALQNFTVPVIPVWDLKENLIKGRTSAPPASRENPFAILTSITGRIMNCLTGVRPRVMTARSYWDLATGFAVNAAISDPAKDQFMASATFENAADDSLPLDRYLLTPSLLRAERGNKQLNYLVTGLSLEDDRWDTLFPVNGAAYETVLTTGDRSMISTYNREEREAILTPFNQFSVPVQRDRSGRMHLELSDEERAVIVDPQWKIYEPKNKERKFPAGSGLTPKATEFLRLIQPDPREPEKDKHYAGLYRVLLDLFTSFSHPALTNQAVDLTAAYMARMKGNNILFEAEGNEVLLGENVQNEGFGFDPAML